MLYLQKGIGDGSQKVLAIFVSPEPTAFVSNACFETEEMMIDHDARPALIYVPNSAELRGPSCRASALTGAAGLSAEDRGDDNVEH